MPLKVLSFEGLISLMKDVQGNRSQEEFANDLGVTTSYLSHIYNGRRSPSENLLARMNVRTQTAYIIPEEKISEVQNQQKASVERRREKK